MGGFTEYIFIFWLNRPTELAKTTSYELLVECIFSLQRNVESIIKKVNYHTNIELAKTPSET